MVLRTQLKNPNFYFMVLCDALIFAIALISAYMFRFEFSPHPFYKAQMLKMLVWVVPFKSIVFIAMGMYSSMWRYTSIRDFWLLARASALATLLIMFFILYAYRFENYSRVVFIADGLFTFLLTGAARMAVRSFFSASGSKFGQTANVKHHKKRVLIIGAGDAGEKILREILDNYKLDYQVTGFIDDDRAKKGRSIHGVRVLGSVDDMAYILERKDIREILIATPSASGDQIRRIVEVCGRCDIPYKILPSMGGLIDGRVSVKVLRDISYEDLLGRPEVNLNIEEIRHYLDGKTVMVTGCGGSIGSELCRQIIKYTPRFLVMLDSSEPNLFQIQMEVQNEKSFGAFQVVLGSVQDEKLMEEIFARYKPEVVFHAAAYKHVPMLEKNPWEAVSNNVIGSRTVMEMAVKHCVEKFVLVSTDKAVRPTNVMGATKRVAELVMQSLRGNRTRFMAVRFGNVVGSSGSVVPLFRRQIEQGGPVTVTHPEVNRYFMTIPEAAQMILQAGAMGKGGEVFILRMGTPVKIADMARDLIRLSGREPDVDIKIVYTGLRDGEKLYEELISEGEDILSTHHEKVMVLRSDRLFYKADNLTAAAEALNKEINELVKAAERHDAKTIKKKLRQIVPEYTPYDNESVL
ncbi:MAG TPA: polysaccharide biosynthesis protein [Deltaproteobacteria bacterium]|nr:polysaccharide biosynthesis protein [Deltaproteobacteria bacterium]